MINTHSTARKASTMFDIIFLGTSASAPSIHRGLTAQVVKHEEFRFLIDCGEGTQRQILKSGIGFKRLNRILITHGHLDHIEPWVVLEQLHHPLAHASGGTQHRRGDPLAHDLGPFFALEEGVVDRDQG